MQQYLEVVTQYCSNENKTNDDKSVTNDELAMALGQIIRETLCGPYLHQLTDYALKLLVMPHDECSASITQQIGPGFAKCIINSYIKMDNTDSNENHDRIEQFISKISSKLQTVLDKLLETLIKAHKSISCSDQIELGRVIDCIDYLFNDKDIDNIDIIILKSNALRSIVSTLYKSVICNKKEIEEKVRNEIITVSFHKKLYDLSTKIIQKYFILLKILKNNNLNITKQKRIEIMNDSLDLTQNIFSECRKSFINNVSIVQTLPHFIKTWIDNLYIVTFNKLGNVFDIIHSEVLFYLNILNNNNNNDLYLNMKKTLFILKLLMPFIIIWNQKHKQIADYNQSDALNFQILSIHKMLKLFEYILVFPMKQNNIDSKIKEMNQLFVDFTTKYFKQIIKCNIINMQNHILKYFETQINHEINNFDIIWFQFLDEVNIEHFDSLSQILQCLDITHSFIQLIMDKCINDANLYTKYRFIIVKYCSNAIIYLLEDDDDGQKEPRHQIMQFCWNKALNIHQNKAINAFWINISIPLILSLPFNYIKSIITDILKCVQMNKCKYLVFVLLKVYIEFFFVENGAFSHHIFNEFISICDDKHSLLYLWNDQYPWNYLNIQGKDDKIMRKIIQKCGESLQNISNGECMKLQNGLHILSLILKHRPVICHRILPMICKLLTKIINEKLFVPINEDKCCINLKSFASVIRVYGIINDSLNMEIRSMFLRYTVEFVYLGSSMIELEVCEHLLPNIKWKSVEINKKNKEFAIQIHCVVLLFQKCLLSNNESVFRQTIIAIKKSQKHLPFDVTILIPNQLKSKVCAIISTL